MVVLNIAKHMYHFVCEKFTCRLRDTTEFVLSKETPLVLLLKMRSLSPKLVILAPTSKTIILQWECGAVDESTANPSMKPQDHGHTRVSAKIMADILKEGSINPHKDPTQRAFETLCSMAP